MNKFIVDKNSFINNNRNSYPHYDYIDKSFHSKGLSNVIHINTSPTTITTILINKEN